MPEPIGTLLRDWRRQRRRSQLELSLDVGVSTRHLSFVETGRSRPSPELVLALADRLDVPLRERNRMLLAAGYAPRYSHRPLEDPSMEAVRTSLQRLLDLHEPFPGVAIDRQWNVVLANDAAGSLLGSVPDHVLAPRPNVFRVCLHPEGLAGRAENWAEWSAYLVGQIRRTVELTGDAELAELEREVRAYPDVAAGADAAGGRGADGDPQVLVPLRLRTDDGVLSLFTTLTTFGTPRDVTVEELCVELFFPADDATRRALGA